MYEIVNGEVEEVNEEESIFKKNKASPDFTKKIKEAPTLAAKWAAMSEREAYIRSREAEANQAWMQKEDDKVLSVLKDTTPRTKYQWEQVAKQVGNYTMSDKRIINKMKQDKQDLKLAFHLKGG